MSTEGNHIDSLDHLSYRREVIGQIRFEPSEGLKDKLSELYLPKVRDQLAKRSLFLSSQYRLVAQQAAGGAIMGEAGQKAEHIQKALVRGNNRPNKLGRYMRTATAVRGGYEFLALQFAIHLDPQIIAAINSDMLLTQEPLLTQQGRTVKAIYVYDTQSIQEGKQRERGIRAIGSYVTGYEIFPNDGGDEVQKSPNTQAYVHNLRFTLMPPHDRER